MSEAEQTIRRLAAILAADVAGYSRLMGADEEGTLIALKRHREKLFNPTVEAHRGRVVKLAGDGTLVEFSSIVDAVQCALAIQRAMHVQAPAGRDGFALRIGINLGDVIIDGDDIYGDGVNIAARLEALAAPGGICVASIVKESVGGRVGAAFEDGGEVMVKNIDRPIRVWTWQPAGDGAKQPPCRAVIESARPRVEQASIAVLPFDNMSGDPEQQYFADGISEDIITDLSKVAGLLVIARNSSFAYRGRSVDIRTVGRELNVTAVLEGSIRRAANRVRITAQLIDASSGTHLWAERYDRDLGDIFALQDEVTQHIVGALKVTLTPTEAARIAEIPTRNAEAHDLFLRGREAVLGKQSTRESFELSVRCLTRAIELDPQYAEPYAGLAHAYNRAFQNNWGDRAEAKALAAHYTERALEKDPNLPYAHYMAAIIKFFERDLAGAQDHLQKALALNPSFALAIGLRGTAKIYDGAPLDALPYIERALRLDPLLGHLYWHFIGSAHLVAGQYRQAAEAFRERIRLVPGTDLSRGFLIAALGHLGEIEDARRVAAELREINPDYSFALHIARLPFTNPADAERISEGYARIEQPG